MSKMLHVRFYIISALLVSFDTASAIEGVKGGRHRVQSQLAVNSTTAQGLCYKRFRDSFVPDAQRTRIVSSFLFSYQDAVELNATGQFLHNTLPTSQEGTVNTYVLLLLLFETQNIIETNLNYLYERLLFLFFFSC